MTPQRRALETRSRILQAARDCFGRLGYDATGVAEICAAAGVTKGAFYHHFPSKHAAFLELLQEWLADLDTQFAAIRSGAANVPQAFVRMAAMAPAIFQAAQGQISFFLEFWTQASRDPAVWQATIDPYRRYREFFASLIQEGIDEGSLRPVDSHVAAQWLVSLAVGLLLQSTLDPHGADWGQAAQDGVGLLMALLQNPAAPQSPSSLGGNP